MPEQNIIPRSRKGLCLIEVLLSLAIMAILLTATAVAFDAALDSYTVNHDLAAVSVSARNALHQMIIEIRSAYNGSVHPTFGETCNITVSGGGTHCLIDCDASDRSVEYWFDSSVNQIKVRVTPANSPSFMGGAWGNWYVLVEDVYPVTVGDQVFRADAQTAGFTPTTIGRVEVRFMISREGITRTFSQSAVPRNILYGLKNN